MGVAVAVAVDASRAWRGSAALLERRVDQGSGGRMERRATEDEDERTDIDSTRQAGAEAATDYSTNPVTVEVAGPTRSRGVACSYQATGEQRIDRSYDCGRGAVGAIKPTAAAGY